MAASPPTPVEPRMRSRLRASGRWADWTAPVLRRHREHIAGAPGEPLDPRVVRAVGIRQPLHMVSELPVRSPVANANELAQGFGVGQRCQAANASTAVRPDLDAVPARAPGAGATSGRPVSLRRVRPDMTYAVAACPAS